MPRPTVVRDMLSVRLEERVRTGSYPDWQSRRRVFRSLPQGLGYGAVLHRSPISYTTTILEVPRSVHLPQSLLPSG